MVARSILSSVFGETEASLSKVLEASGITGVVGGIISSFADDSGNSTRCVSLASYSRLCQVADMLTF